MTNPLVEAVPVRRVPPQLLAGLRDDEEAIPLYLLHADQPAVYKLAPGDVLGVWVEGVVGNENLPVPVNFPQRFLPPERAELPPALGYPFAVRDDGTLSLPLIKPIPVDGLTIEQADEAIRKAYTVTNKILKPGAERIFVTLMRPRLHHIVVFRHDAPPINVNANFDITTTGVPGGGSQLMGSSLLGTGHIVDLPVTESDLLHALAVTGGFPGTTAADHVMVYRSYFQPEQARGVLNGLAGIHPPLCLPNGAPPCDGRITRIPIRMHAGAIPEIPPQDVMLHSGDAVFVEARQVGTFYTGGLLPPGEFLLPHDYDIDVIEAVARVRGPMLNGEFGGSNLSGTLVVAGIGSPSPSLLVVLRRTPDGGQIPIRVDLNRAFQDARERIPVRPGDVLVLQETPGEAIARYFTDVFKLNLLYRSFPPNRASTTSSATVP